MKLLRKKKNKKFNYQPRHYEYDGEGSPFAMRHKFDHFRTTVGEDKGLKNKFLKIKQDLKVQTDRNTRLRLLIILTILILIFLYLIDFDLSIFQLRIYG